MAILLEEIWKSVPSHDGYEVSNLGRVRSFRVGSGSGRMHDGPPTIMRLRMLKNGYSRVLFCRKYKRSEFLIHRLVLMVFVGPCPDEHEAAHLNGRRDDNRLENIKWVTAKENNSHKHLHGTARTGEKCATKLSEKEVKEIREKCRSGEVTQYKLAKHYHVSAALISLIRNNKRWKFLRRGNN